MSSPDYPLWPELIATLQDRCGLRAEDLRSVDFLDVAQAAKDKNPEEYARTLDETLRRKERPVNAKRDHLLARFPS